MQIISRTDTWSKMFPRTKGEDHEKELMKNEKPWKKRAENNMENKFIFVIGVVTNVIPKMNKLSLFIYYKMSRVLNVTPSFKKI